MTLGKEVKDFLDSITAMVSNSATEIVSVSAHVADAMNGIDRTITYSVKEGTINTDCSVVSPFQIYERLWKCRDFEISLVWTRVAFMTAFMLGCFVAYGHIVSDLIVKAHFLWESSLNGVCACVCAFGLAISILWVALAKGSKAWYEMYENAIAAFSKKYGGTDVSWKHVIGGDWWCMEQFPFERIEYKWWDFGAGGYSVSKVNVCIGFYFSAIWILLLIFHILCVLNLLPDFVRMHLGGTLTILACIVAIIGVIAGFLFVRSGVLTKKHCNECADSGKCEHSHI